MKLQTICCTLITLGLFACNSSTDTDAKDPVPGSDTEIGDDNVSEPEDGNGSEPEDGNVSEPEDGNGSEPEDGNVSEPEDGNGSELKASWMQGNWGISYRIPGGDITYSGSVVDDYQVTAAVEKMASIPGLNWVQLNLTNGAFGDRYIVPVPEVEAINPISAPNSKDDLHDPALPGADLFGQIATALQAKGIKVVAYIATQGPAMLKHGAEKSMDYDNSIIDESDDSACKSTRPLVSDPDTQVYCSENMNRWRDYVLTTYPSTSLHRSFELAMVNIVETLSLRYGTLIDGWWFDHSIYGDSDLLHAAALAGNNDAAVSLNQGDKVPLVNNPDTKEDYTFGHPTPVASAVPSDDKNLPMLTSIEATPDGVFTGSDDDVDAVGHLFMPLQQAWNGGTVVFSEAKGSDWLNRALKAGGTLTWALSQEGSTSNGEARVISEPQTKLLRRMQFNINQQLHMNLNGADGSTAYDNSVNQHTATVNGATFIDDASRGTVASFTEADNLTINSYTGVLGDTARTTTAWLKTTDKKGDIIQWGNSAAGEQWLLRLVGGIPRLLLGDATVIGTTSLNDDQWHHIAVVAPDNTVGNIQIYINGILENVSVNGNTSTFNTMANTVENGDVQLGGSYTGLLDKVTLHKRALAETEIDYLVNSVNADLDLAVSYDLRFNEVSGNDVSDSSSYIRPATNKGATVGIYDSTRDSEVYSFDGNATVVADRYNGINGADPRTVMAWIKATNGNGTIIKWGNTDATDTEQYVVRVKNDALRVSITGGTISGTTLLNDGEWHHIAVVSPDEKLSNTKLYVDGVLESTTLAGDQTTIDTQTLDSKSIDVEIGADFIGEMDDVLIHQRALKLFEIKAKAGIL